VIEDREVDNQADHHDHQERRKHDAQEHLAGAGTAAARIWKDLIRKVLHMIKMEISWMSDLVVRSVQLVHFNQVESRILRMLVTEDTHF